MKVDLVIGAVAAAALAATALGLVLYEGPGTVTFVEEAHGLTAQDGALADQVPSSFSFDVPDNATAAVIDITISHQGRAVLGGTATVHVEAVAPDGSVTPSTHAVTIEAGTTSGSHGLEVPVRWMDPPKDQRGPGGAVAWDRPLEVRVGVTAPADTPPLSEYTFHAKLGGRVLAYRAVPLVPEGAGGP